MRGGGYLRWGQVLTLAISFFLPLDVSQGQGVKLTAAGSSLSDPDADHVKERNEWFYRGRVVRGLPAAELRRRAYQAKLRLRAQRAMASPQASAPVSFSTGSWVPLGPVPLASDASGNGTQDYHQVAGRATAVVIDPADSSGNTIYIGGAQSGVWRSTNAANPIATNVTWTPTTDNQATLSIGAIAIQPGNNDPARTLILAATGEAPYQLRVTPNPSGSSFSPAVTFSCSGLPSGAQCGFSPVSVTPGNSAANAAMTITTGVTTTAGSYQVDVTGTAGTLSHSVAVALVVTNSGSVNPQDFQLALTQAFPNSVTAGTSQTAKISITSGYSGAVDATCDASAIPAAQCIITPANPVAIKANVPVSLTITLNLPNDAMPGAPSVTVTVADQSGQPGHQLALRVNIASDFIVSAGTSSQTVTGGQTSGPYALTVRPVGSSFSGAVTLSCSAGLPTGAQCIFNPSTPVTPGNAAVDVVMNISTKTSSVHSQSLISGHSFPPVFWLPLAAIVVGLSSFGSRNPRRARRILGCSAFCVAMMVFASCAGVSSGGGGGDGQTPPPATYQITITGTSPGTLSDAGQSTTVTLIVN